MFDYVGFSLIIWSSVQILTFRSSSFCIVCRQLWCGWLQSWRFCCETKQSIFRCFLQIYHCFLVMSACSDGFLSGYGVAVAALRCFYVVVNIWDASFFVRIVLLPSLLLFLMNSWMCLMKYYWFSLAVCTCCGSSGARPASIVIFLAARRCSWYCNCVCSCGSWLVHWRLLVSRYISKTICLPSRCPYRLLRVGVHIFGLGSPIFPVYYYISSSFYSYFWCCLCIVVYYGPIVLKSNVCCRHVWVI